MILLSLLVILHVNVVSTTVYMGTSKHKLYEGEMFSFACEISVTKLNGENYTANASKLLIQHGGDNFTINSGNPQLTQTSPTTVLFTIPHVTPGASGDSGHYYCATQITLNGTTTEYWYDHGLIVGTIPTPPLLISCIWNHGTIWNYLECRWSTRNPEPVDHTCNLILRNVNSSLSYYSDYCDKSILNDTIIYTMNNTMNMTTLNYDDQYTIEYIIYSVIRDGDVFTSGPQFIGSLRSIVQPGTPTVRPSEAGTNDVRISISPQDDIADLVYNVSYVSSWDPQQTISITNRSVTLHHLMPYTNYKVTVRCRTLESPNWSEEAVADFTTLPTAVSSSVNMTGGGYYVDAKSCVEDICNVTIYWEKLSPALENGPGFRYDIKATPSPDCLQAVQSRTSHRYSATVHINLSCSWIVEVVPYNAYGSAAESASITITYGSPVEYSSIYAMRDTNIIHVVLDHRPASVISDVVFWCQSVNMNACQSEMQWREMGNKTTNFDLSVGHADVEDLLIGVSSKTVYRQLHSIQWLNCIYDMNSAISAPEMNQPICINETIVVTWEQSSCKPPHNGVITLYTLYYCKVDSSDVCLTDEVSVNISRYHLRYIVNDTEAGAKYAIRMGSTSMKGRTVTTEAKFIHIPQPSTKDTAAFKIIIASVVIIVVVTGISLCLLIRKIYKFTKQKLVITVPKSEIYKDPSSADSAHEYHGNQPTYRSQPYLSDNTTEALRLTTWIPNPAYHTASPVHQGNRSLTTDCTDAGDRYAVLDVNISDDRMLHERQQHSSGRNSRSTESESHTGVDVNVDNESESHTGVDVNVDNESESHTGVDVNVDNTSDLTVFSNASAPICQEYTARSGSPINTTDFIDTSQVTPASNYAAIDHHTSSDNQFNDDYIQHSDCAITDNACMNSDISNAQDVPVPTDYLPHFGSFDLASQVAEVSDKSTDIPMTSDYIDIATLHSDASSPLNAGESDSVHLDIAGSLAGYVSHNEMNVMSTLEDHPVHIPTEDQMSLTDFEQHYNNKEARSTSSDVIPKTSTPKCNSNNQLNSENHSSFISETPPADECLSHYGDDGDELQTSVFTSGSSLVLIPDVNEQSSSVDSGINDSLDGSDYLRLNDSGYVSNMT